MSNRPKRMYRGGGTARQRADGRWEVRVSVDGRRVSGYGATLEEARAAAAKAAGSIPTMGTGNGATLGAWLDVWLEQKRTALKPETWRKYEMHVRRFIKPAIGDVRLTQLSPRDIDRLHAVCARRVAGTTAHHVHTTLSSAMAAALKRGLVTTNVLQTVGKPRRSGTEVRILSRDELDRFLTAVNGEPLEALWRIAVRLGPRLGELLALQWKDVDLDRGRIEILANATRSGNGTIMLTTPKTASSRRVLAPLPPAIVDALRRQTRTSDFVWPGRDGGPMAQSSFHKYIWTPFRRRADVEGVTFHALRHTAATTLLESGVPAHVVAAILGHSSVATTLRLYAHVTRVGMDSAMDAVAALDSGGLRVVSGGMGS